MEKAKETRARMFPYADVLVTAKRPTESAGIWWELNILGTEVIENREHLEVHRVYFQSDELLKVFLKWIENMPSLGTVIDGGSVEYADWESFLHGGFEPFAVGDLFIVPAEKTPPIPPGKKPLKIIPGRGFGTGSHPTTRLIMSFIAKYWQPGSVLDVGTGSGILTLQTTLSGSESVVAVDIDADSLENARENLAVNKVEQIVTLRKGSLETVNESGFSMIFVNIITPILRKLVEDGLLKKLKSNGIIFFSGVLAVELHSFIEFLKDLGMTIMDQASINEWCAVVARLPE
jgi:ribosomal protein L11 methyltransferase